MSTQTLLTYADAIEHLRDFAAGAGLSVNQPQLRRAVQAAYTEVVQAHEWPYFVVPHRIHLMETQDDGTLAYTHSTRTVTLTGATFTDWTAGASIFVDDKLCEIESITDATNAVLSSAMNPGADLTGEDYTLFRRWHELPADFLAITEPISEELRRAQSVPMSEMLELHAWRNQTDTARCYAVGPSLLNYGVNALYTWPPAAADSSLDMLYRRKARELRYSGAVAVDRAGTIAITSGSNTATGTSTSFLADHVGSVLRISSDDKRPTGRFGDKPYIEEHKILAVDVDAQTLTLQEVVSTTDVDAGYLITDPIDLDPVVFQAFLHCAEKQVIIGRDPEKAGRVIGNYLRALAAAKGADAKTIQRRVVGGTGRYRPRLADLGAIVTTIQE